MRSKRLPSLPLPLAQGPDEALRTQFEWRRKPRWQVSEIWRGRGRKPQRSATACTSSVRTREFPFGVAAQLGWVAPLERIAVPAAVAFYLAYHANGFPLPLVRPVPLGRVAILMKPRLSSGLCLPNHCHGPQPEWDCTAAVAGGDDSGGVSPFPQVILLQH